MAEVLVISGVDPEIRRQIIEHLRRLNPHATEISVNHTDPNTAFGAVLEGAEKGTPAFGIFETQ